MNGEAATSPAAIDRPFEEHPYPPGWLDRTIDWIDRMPGANGIYSLALLVVQLAWVAGLLWLGGKTSIRSIDLPRTFLVVITPYLLWFRFHLDRHATAALQTFRAALDVSDAEFRRLNYELTTLSARATRIVTAVAVVVLVVNFFVMPEWVFMQYTPSRTWSLATFGPIALLTLIVVAISTAQAIHQLQMVDRIHGLVGRIHLFRVKPLYAFSGLAARTGVSYALLSYYIAAAQPGALRESPALQVTVLAMILTAVACFILPLRGMHRRLVAEKDRMLLDASLRFETLLARLHERVERNELTDADKLNAQIASVTAEREAVGRISTWPWAPTTLTGFVSALLLPVLLWVIQRLLARFGL